MTQDNCIATTATSEIEDIGKTLADHAARLQRILSAGQADLDRRYGPVPEVAGPSEVPNRCGTIGALRDAVDAVERAVDRASYVVTTLGQA